MTHPLMTPHLRQYRHNRDNSPSIIKPRDGFVVAYDQEGTDSVVAKLVADCEALRAHNEALTAALKDAIDYSEGVEMYAGEWSFFERCANLIEAEPDRVLAAIKASIVYEVATAIRQDLAQGVDAASACKTWQWASEDIRKGKTWMLAPLRGQS